MKISIIVPVFNGEKYLKRCVDSILAQTFLEFELILVNDGSQDKSLEMCAQFASTDNRIKVISKEESEGAGPARNSGIDASNGEYLMFLDADDFTSPNMLKKLYDIITKGNLDLAICGYDSFVEDAPNYTEAVGYSAKTLANAEEVRTFFVENFPEGVVGYLWNKIYKAQIIHENNLRFPAMRRLQDGVFNTDYWGFVNSCEIIPDALYHYMLNPQTGLFKKCPPDYYDLIRRFSKGFSDTAVTWNIEAAVNDRKINVFFLNELTNCFENANSKNWSMDRKMRRQYYTKLLRDGFARENLREKDIIKKNIGRYRRTLLWLFSKRRFGIMDFIISFKIMLKKHAKKLFYKLKGAS